MITECKCPRCNKEIYDYADFESENQYCDDDTFFIDYTIHCNCGCKFVYTEWFKLCETAIEEI